MANAPEDVLQDEHLHAREFFRPVQGVQQPNYFVRTQHSNFRIPDLVPQPRDESESLLKRLLNLSSERIQQLRREGVV